MGTLARYLSHRTRPTGARPLCPGQVRDAKQPALEAAAPWADQQHAWVLAGDVRGMYGDYPPVI